MASQAEGVHVDPNIQTTMPQSSGQIRTKCHNQPSYLGHSSSYPVLTTMISDRCQVPSSLKSSPDLCITENFMLGTSADSLGKVRFLFSSGCCCDRSPYSLVRGTHTEGSGAVLSSHEAKKKNTLIAESSESPKESAVHFKNLLRLTYLCLIRPNSFCS